MPLNKEKVSLDEQDTLLINAMFEFLIGNLLARASKKRARLNQITNERPYGLDELGAKAGEALRLRIEVDLLEALSKEYAGLLK